MSTEPWIGDEHEGSEPTCGYHLVEFGDELCGAPCTIHIMSESAIHGAVSLSACDQHAAIARAAGAYIAEHPFGLHCSPETTLWFPEGCRSMEEAT